MWLGGFPILNILLVVNELIGDNAGQLIAFPMIRLFDTFGLLSLQA